LGPCSDVIGWAVYIYPGNLSGWLFSNERLENTRSSRSSEFSVMCDEFGRVTFAYPGSGWAQSLLRICSGWLTFWLTLIPIFGQLAPQHVQLLQLWQSRPKIGAHI